MSHKSQETITRAVNYPQNKQPFFQPSLNPTNEIPLSQYSLPFMSILPIFLTLGLSGFYFGYIVVYLGAVNIQSIIKYYDLSMSAYLAMGVLNGVLSLGGGVGCFMAVGFLARLSRRNCVIVTGLIAIVANFALFIPNQATLILSRFIQGLCLGLYSTIVPMYIRQLSPLHLAGTFGAMFQFFMACGTVFCFLLTYILCEIFDDDLVQRVWYVVFGFTLITTIVQMVLLAFKYRLQTPKYLIMNGREGETKELLRRLYKEEWLDLMCEKLKRDMVRQDEDNQNEKFSQEQSQIDSLVDSSITVSLSAGKPLSTPILAIITGFFMSFSQQMVGSGAVAIYGGQLVSQLLPNLTHQGGLIINFPQLVSSFILGYLLSKYNRKSILQMGMVSLAIMDVFIGIGFVKYNQEGSSVSFWAYTILISQFIYNFIYAISVGSMLWVIMPAIIQPHLLPYATFMNWVGSAIVLIVFPLLKNSLLDNNPALLFFFFAIYTALCAIIYSKIVIEIRDKPERQIYREYQKMTLCK